MIECEFCGQLVQTYIHNNHKLLVYHTHPCLDGGCKGSQRHVQAKQQIRKYIIAPPKYALAKYALYEETSNPNYPKVRAFSGAMEGNVQGLLDLIDKSEPFGLEVRV